MDCWIFPHHLLAVDCTLIWYIYIYISAFCLISIYIFCFKWIIPQKGEKVQQAMSSDVKRNGHLPKPTRWCPSSLAKLVQITPISLWFMDVYGRYIAIVFMGFINPLITGGHHPVCQWRSFFVTIEPRRHRLNDAVSFPLEALELTPYRSSPEMLQKLVFFGPNYGFKTSF